MPVYDYKCKEHGVFYDLATLQDSDKPACCPICTELSPRIIRIAPEVLDMPAQKKHAHETNERSQHEPQFSTEARRKDDEEHSRGCGCAKKKPGSKLFLTANGDKMFPSMRPWMISH